MDFDSPVPYDVRDSFRAQIRASILWLMSKAYRTRTPDGIRSDIPEALLEPLIYYVNDVQSMDYQFKPAIIRNLTSGEYYRLCLTNIYSDRAYMYFTNSDVVDFLQNREIFEDHLINVFSEEALSQTAPFQFKAHMAIITGLMRLYIEEVLDHNEIFKICNDFTTVSDDEKPDNSEEAALFWINKSCHRKKQEILQEDYMGQLDDMHTYLTNHNQPLPGDEDWMPLVPLTHLTDISDGCSLATLISLYCPNDFSWTKIIYNNQDSINDSIYNLKMIQNFCYSLMPYNICFLTVDDLLYVEKNLEINVLTFIADLMFEFVIEPCDLVIKPEPLTHYLPLSHHHIYSEPIHNNFINGNNNIGSESSLKLSNLQESIISSNDSPTEKLNGVKSDDPKSISEQPYTEPIHPIQHISSNNFYPNNSEISTVQPPSLDQSDAIIHDHTMSQDTLSENLNNLMLQDTSSPNSMPNQSITSQNLASQQNNITEKLISLDKEDNILSSFKDQKSDIEVDRPTNNIGTAKPVSQAFVIGQDLPDSSHDLEELMAKKREAKILALKNRKLAESEAKRAAKESETAKPPPPPTTQVFQAFVIGSDFANPDYKDEEQMRKKKEAVEIQSQKRDQERKAKRMARENELARQKEEANFKKEKSEQRKQEQKQRREIILEQYRQRKISEEAEKDKTTTLSKSNTKLLSLSNKSIYNNRPGSSSSEYSKPKLFAKPTTKTNLHIAQNAIAKALEGTANVKTLKKMQETLDRCKDCRHFLILFRDRQQFRGLYDYDSKTESILKLDGIGPKAINHEDIHEYYKFDSPKRQFAKVDTKSLSLTIVAISIHEYLWPRISHNFNRRE